MFSHHRIKFEWLVCTILLLASFHLKLNKKKPFLWGLLLAISTTDMKWLHTQNSQWHMCKLCSQPGGQKMSGPQVELGSSVQSWYINSAPKCPEPPFSSLSCPDYSSLVLHFLLMKGDQKATSQQCGWGRGWVDQGSSQSSNLLPKVPHNASTIPPFVNDEPNTLWDTQSKTMKSCFGVPHNRLGTNGKDRTPHTIFSYTNAHKTRTSGFVKSLLNHPQKENRSACGPLLVTYAATHLFGWLSLFCCVLFQQHLQTPTTWLSRFGLWGLWQGKVV